MKQAELNAMIRTALLAGALLLAGCKPMPITLDADQWVCTDLKPLEKRWDCVQWTKVAGL